MAERITVVVLGTADWNQPIATNQHYVTAALATEFDVRFIESIGLRRPELRLRDLKRIAKRFVSMLSRRNTSEGHHRPRRGVRVVTPFVLPVHSGVFAVVNRLLFNRVMNRALDGASKNTVLWTYSPVTYGAERHFDGFVYHCVDLLGEVNGISAAVIESGERRIAPLLDQTIATTELVASNLRKRGHDPILWPNVADTSTIEAAEPTSGSRVSGRVVFAGNLAPQKVDFPLMRKLLEAGVDLHLAGPIAEGGGESRDEVQELIRLGAVYHGSLTLPDLSALYWTACVGLIPYVINDYTRGVSPLKTFEYLATGLSVVSTPVPSVDEVAGHVQIESDHGRFVQAVVKSASTPTKSEIEARREISHRNSWIQRGEAARQIATNVAVSGPEN